MEQEEKRQVTLTHSKALSEPEKHIRHTVFEVEQGFYDEFDEIDQRAIHILAWLDDQAVGVCRIFTQEDPEIFFLGRLAVVKDLRNQHIGAAILQKAEELAKAEGGRQLRLHSQIQAEDFYKKCGYQREGEVELEQGYPHVWMVKDF